MSPIVAVQYTPRCAVCGVLGITPWMLFWQPGGRWDALCEHCSIALVVVASAVVDNIAEST